MTVASILLYRFALIALTAYLTIHYSLWWLLLLIFFA